ncbi:alpha/beta hydrolase [Sulfurimonas sp.]|nr:alpha/beta hydrolase [Sulfurimonas sp.]
MAVKSIQFNQHTLDVSYEIVNPNAKVDLIILHGWGSSKRIMKNSFSSYMDSFRHIYIDLPGFGNSTCNLTMSTKDYARVVELLMIHLNASKDVIMGHSFGGKVALLLEPKVLVLLSSAGIYVPKSLIVKAKISITKVCNFIGLSKLPKLFRAADAKTLNEPMYETFKNVVNEDFSDDFSAFENKALLCWGEDDTATPFHTGMRINKLIKDSSLLRYPGDHFFFINCAEDISQNVEKTFLSTLGHK